VDLAYRILRLQLGFTGIRPVRDSVDQHFDVVAPIFRDTDAGAVEALAIAGMTGVVSACSGFSPTMR
jgi:hypothetical protein